MASLKDPVGPHSPSVYRRRRLVALLVLIAIPVVVLLIIFKPGSTGGVTERQKVDVPADIKSGSTKKATTNADDLPGCKKSNLTVTAVASKESYAAGESPEIWMTISNSGTKPCVVDLGTKELSFSIKSGDEVYWNSVDCQTGADSREVILSPENPLSTQKITWDRTRNSPETCAVAREPVPAGGAAYKVTATANGVESAEPWQFLLN